MAKSHPVAPPSGFRHGGKTYKPGQRLPKKYARVVEDGAVSLDPARGIPGAPPNFGRDVLPQILTFSGRWSAHNQVYRNPDIAYNQGPEQARIMRNDCAIMECLEARQRGTALLNWHIEPEDKKDDRQRKMADDLTDVLQATPDFTEYRRNLLEAIWYGRYANQHAYGSKTIKGKKRVVVKRWSPINGDKLVFRYDDGTGKYSGDEVGIKVGLSYGRHDAVAGDRKIEMTDQGPAYFLEPWERSRIALHRHVIEDGVYEDSLSAGRIHGVGVRDRIYWCWFQKQETMAHLMEVIERTGSGFTIYYYPAHDPAAKAAMEDAAKNQQHQNILLFPRSPGDPAFDAYGIDRIEPSTAGIDALKSVVHEFFGWQIKRYIIGQVLSSEAEGGGIGGSGIADLHQETMSAIIKYDAVKLEETMTRELLRHVQGFNPDFAWARDINFRFVIDTESANAEKKLAAFRQGWDMGLRLKASDVYDSVGASMPTEDDEVLQNPQMAAQGGMPGEQPGQDGMNAADMFGPLMDDGDAGGDEPADTTGPDGGDNPTDGGAPGVPPGPDQPVGPVQYAKPSLGGDPRWKTKHQPGETMTKGSHTYVLNEHHRWERQDKDDVRTADTIDANSTPPGKDKPDEGGAMAKLGIDPKKPFTTGAEDRKAFADKMNPGQPLLDGQDAPEPSHEDRHAHVAKALGGIDEQAGGLIRAFHEHPDYKSGGEVASQKLDPHHAAGLKIWLRDASAKGDGPEILMPDGKKLKSSKVGGGIAVDFGDGRMGFASEAGSFIVDQSGKANYTSKTGIVSSAMMGGKPMLGGKTPNSTAKPPIPAEAGVGQPQQGQQPNGMQSTNPATQASGPATAAPTPPSASTSPVQLPVAAPTSHPEIPDNSPNPHRENAGKAHAEWQEAVKGMADAGNNGADAKDLAAWSRYVTHKRKVFREYDLAAKHHDKQQKKSVGGKGPPSPPGANVPKTDADILREKFGIGDPSRVVKPTQTVDPKRAKFGTPEAKAEAEQEAAARPAPSPEVHAHHSTLHEALSNAAANEPDDAKASQLAAQAVHHEALADHHSAAVHGPEVHQAMADAHQQLSGHSPAVHSAIQAAHEALHKSGLAEAPTGQGGYVPPSDEALAKLKGLGQKSAKPTGDEPEALKKSVKWQLTNNSLHTHDQNVDAIHEAIERGQIKSADDLKNVLKAAKGIQEKGRTKGDWNKRSRELQKALAKSDDKGRRAIETELLKHDKLNPDENTHLAVKEALRRKIGRKERAPTVKPEAMLAEGAKRHGIEPEEYADLADHVWQTEGMNSPNRKPEGYADGVRALRAHSGFKSAAAAHNNDETELSDETYMVFREHPELGVDPNSSPQEIEDAAWEILKSDDDGGSGIPSKNSPEYWAFADDAIRQMKEHEAANPPSDEEESVPFAARWRDGYTARQYAAAAYVESQHPRAADGKWTDADHALVEHHVRLAAAQVDMGKTSKTQAKKQIEQNGAGHLGQVLSHLVRNPGHIKLPTHEIEQKFRSEMASRNAPPPPLVKPARLAADDDDDLDDDDREIVDAVRSGDWGPAVSKFADKEAMAAEPDKEVSHVWDLVYEPDHADVTARLESSDGSRMDLDAIKSEIHAVVSHLMHEDAYQQRDEKNKESLEAEESARDTRNSVLERIEEIGKKHGWRKYYDEGHDSKYLVLHRGGNPDDEDDDSPEDDIKVRVADHSRLTTKHERPGLNIIMGDDTSGLNWDGIEKVLENYDASTHKMKTFFQDGYGDEPTKYQRIDDENSIGYTVPHDEQSPSPQSRQRLDGSRNQAFGDDDRQGSGQEARAYSRGGRGPKAKAGDGGISSSIQNVDAEGIKSTRHDGRQGARGQAGGFSQARSGDAAAAGSGGIQPGEHSEEVSVELYAKKPLKSTKGQTNMFGTTHGIEGAGPATPYDEKKHSRGPGSQFRHIGPDDSKGQGKIGFDESKHPRGQPENKGEFAPKGTAKPEEAAKPEGKPLDLAKTHGDAGRKLLAGTRIKFHDGEYSGKTGVVTGTIQGRYTKEDVTHHIQIDGFPKPGGWNGKVTATAAQLSKQATEIPGPTEILDEKPADPFSLARPGEYQPPKGPPEEKPVASGGKQEKMFHGMDDLPGQQDLFNDLDGPAPSPAVPKGPEPKGDGGASSPADDAAYARHAAEMKAAGIATLPKAEWIARRDAILAKRKENLANRDTNSDKVSQSPPQGELAARGKAQEAAHQAKAEESSQKKTPEFLTEPESKKEEPESNPAPKTPEAKPFADDPSDDDDTPPANETPRQTADRKAKSNYEESGDYAYARKSAVQNAGEDLLGSARHKRNAWRSLAEAEKDGTAAELVTREHLIKNEPHNLLAKVTPKNALSSLAGHFAINAFPAAPFDEATLKAYSKAYVTRDGHKASHPSKEVRSRTPEELRKQYYDAYNDVKSEVEKSVAAGDEPNKVMQKVHDLTKRLIHKYRDATGPADDYISGVTAADRFNPVANALVDLHNRAKPQDNPRRYKTNSVGGKLRDFADRLGKHYGQEPSEDMLEKAAGHAQDIMEGHSFNKTFGTVGTKATEFNPADLYVKHATRKGGRVIDAKNVEAATKFMTDNLGMRGIQYGNSVTDDERQHHLQKTSEAFADLMDVTGLDDNQASMNGKLGIAFGARGHGTASAHYEPSKQVINLTRKDGVGTLAHEWGHFFDHTLTDYNISHGLDKSVGDYQSNRISNERFKTNKHGGVILDDKKKPTLIDYTKEPIHAAFNDLRDTWKESGFDTRVRQYCNAKVSDGKMSEGKRKYWLSNHEKFARCFERYVQHKLAKNDRENTYLSGMDKGHELWPTDEEVAKMAPKFDAIFKAYRDKSRD